MRTLWRTLLLVILGLLVLGSMALWVKLTQPHPADDDPLRVSVPRDIVMPWDDAELWIDFTGAEGVRAPAQQHSAPLLFLIDTSGSMRTYLDDARRAVFDMQLNLASSGMPVRIGLMEFAEEAKIVSPFTSDMSELAQRLQSSWPGAGGGTTFLAGLTEALAMMDATGEQGTVVMLTDGEAAESNSALAQFYQDRWKRSGHELYLLGIGSASDPASFFSLTDDPPRYILSSASTNTVGLLFQEVAARMGNALGRRAMLSLPLAEPLWRWGDDPGTETDATAERAWLRPHDLHPEQFRIGTLFSRAYQWRAVLDPRMGGILKTLHAPPQLRYTTQPGEDYQVEPGTGAVPKVLVVTWLFLFMLMLPALVYLLATWLAWLFRAAAEPPELEPVRWRKEYRPPPNLPLRFPPDAQRIDWTPTLVLGLGGSARAVLTHIKQNLADSFDHHDSRPILLSLDVARDELRDGAGEPVPGCLDPLSSAEVFVPPAESCALYDAVHQQQDRVIRDSTDPAAALNLTPYADMGAEALRLSKGTQGQAPLARLALLNDLANGAQSALLNRLGQALDNWRRVSPEQRRRQILLVANVRGGVGAGWLTDLLILMRRLVAEDERAGQAVEINVLLIGEARPKRGAVVPLDAPILFAELDRLATAGSRPFQHRLAKPPAAVANGAGKDSSDSVAAFLDGLVSRRPQDAIFVLPLRGGDDTKELPAAADAAVLLLDQRRRTELTYQLQAVQGTEVRRRAEQGRELHTEIAVHNAVFPRSFFRELLLNRLVNLLGNRQILFPELEHEGGRVSLKTQPIDGAALCGTDAAADPAGILAAVCQAALGRCDSLGTLSLDADSLSEAANVMRLALISNANREFREGSLGLLALARMTDSMAKQLRACLDQVGGSPVLADLASTLDALNRHALTWIELFFGSRLLVELGDGPVLGDHTGMLVDRSTQSTQVIERLAEWEQGRSRTLLAPIAAADLADRDALGRKLDDLLSTFIKGWLGAEKDLGDALAERCHWEMSAPGFAGEPIGIGLVLRGSKAHRYGPSLSELARFEADLRDEAGPVLDRSSDFHVLSMLRSNIHDDSDQALVAFAESLKGSLRGERSSLLATVPDLSGIHDPQLHAFRTKLVRTLRDLTVNAAERVKVVGLRDRNRISVLQTVPLLQAEVGQRGRVDGMPDVLHRPERLLQRETTKLADALGRDGMVLPPVVGIALEDRDRLQQFARLYQNGQINRNPIDGLWYVRTVGSQRRLTLMQSQSLADAAAYYVSHALHTPVDDRSPLRPELHPETYRESYGEPDDVDVDFTDYLAWLAAN